MQRLTFLALAYAVTEAVMITKKGGRNRHRDEAEPAEPFNGLALGDTTIEDAFAAADLDGDDNLDCAEMYGVWADYSTDGRTTR